MTNVKAQLTVFFEGPFWVGVYERQEDDQLSVCKMTFGSEPKTVEVYELLLKHYRQLTFSRGISVEAAVEKRINPKRLQRAVKAEAQREGIGTKAQEAIKQQQTEKKQARKVQSKAEREAEAERQFQLKQTKRKEKHRGH